MTCETHLLAKNAKGLKSEKLLLFHLFSYGICLLNSENSSSFTKVGFTMVSFRFVFSLVHITKLQKERNRLAVKSTRTNRI